jgi:hypothetical protein
MRSLRLEQNLFELFLARAGVGDGRPQDGVLALLLVAAMKKFVAVFGSARGIVRSANKQKKLLPFLNQRHLPIDAGIG